MRVVIDQRLTSFFLAYLGVGGKLVFLHIVCEKVRSTNKLDLVVESNLLPPATSLRERVCVNKS